MQRLTLAALSPFLLTACPTSSVPVDSDTESSSSGETSSDVTLTTSASTSVGSTTDEPTSTSVGTTDDSTSLATTDGSSESGTSTETSTTTDAGTTTGSDGLVGCDELVADPVPFTIEGNVEGAGDDHPARVPCLIYAGGEDVSYGWVVPADGLYRIFTAGAQLTLLDGCTEPADVIACDTPVRTLYEIDLAAGQEVAIVADSYSPNSGKGSFDITVESTACDDAVDLGSDSPLSAEVSLDGDDDLSGSCGAAPFQNWEENVFTWTAPATGMYEFSTDASGTWIYAYVGTCGDYRDELGCTGSWGTFSAAVSEGDTVYVVVDGGFFADDVSTIHITQIDELAGDCCTAHFGPGCEDAAITNCLCGEGGLPLLFGPDAIDSCCSGDWDETCVSAAAALGCADCPQQDGGSCCMGVDVSPEPGCDVETIETCVCDLHPECCGFEGWGWDSLCAYVAQLDCGASC